MSITLEMEANVKKVGRVCDPSYRAGKNCPLVLRTQSEDLMTANVFGMLKHLPPHTWLAPLLNRALKTTRFSRSAFRDLRLSFWKDFDPPAARRGIEGPSEVDLAISFDDNLVFVEAKLGAEISQRTARDPKRDQVGRLLDVAREHCCRSQLFEREPFVVVIGMWRRPPAIMRRYMPPTEQCVGYASWRDVADTVAPLDTEASVPGSIARDVRAYLARKVQEHEERSRRRLIEWQGRCSSG